MRVREVIPFGKTDEEMETREGERRTVEVNGGEVGMFTRVISCLSFVF